MTGTESRLPNPDPHLREVKSYVLRHARMSKLQRRAFETLYSEYTIPASSAALDLPLVFAARRRTTADAAMETQANVADTPRNIILEIGFGMGEATADIAEQNPDKDYLAIEVHRPGVGKLLSEIDARGLRNLLIVNHDAVQVVQRMIPDGSLSGVHAFFPDPWPKKRHLKRRLFQREFAALLARKIRDGGYLYVVTDWEQYAFQILEVLSLTENLRNTTIDFVPRQPWRPVTRFEEKGVAQGHEVYEILFRKRAGR